MTGDERGDGGGIVNYGTQQEPNVCHLLYFAI